MRVIDTFKNDPTPWQILKVVKSNIEFRPISSLDNSTKTIFTKFICDVCWLLVEMNYGNCFNCWDGRKQMDLSLIYKINYISTKVWVGTYLIVIEYVFVSEFKKHSSTCFEHLYDELFSICCDSKKQMHVHLQNKLQTH